MGSYEKIRKSAKSLEKCFPHSFRVEFSEYDGIRFITINVLKWRFGDNKAHYLKGNARTAYGIFCKLCDDLSEEREEPDEVSVLWNFPDFHVYLDTTAIG